jgi:sec-independent protein translocase protein TatA
VELGSGEIFIILLVALLIYGGRLPQVAMALGRSLREFKRGMEETKNLVRSHVEVDLDAVAPAPRKVVRMPEDLPEDEEEPAEEPAQEDLSAATDDGGGRDPSPSD